MMELFYFRGANFENHLVHVKEPPSLLIEKREEVPGLIGCILRHLANHDMVLYKGVGLLLKKRSSTYLQEKNEC